jgi:hypothetical protein
MTIKEAKNIIQKNGFKTLREDSGRLDLDGLLLAIKKVRGKNVGVQGLIEVGPDSPIVAERPVTVEVIKDKILFSNDCVSFVLRTSKIEIAETEDSNKFIWNILMSNGQEFIIDLRV